MGLWSKGSEDMGEGAFHLSATVASDGEHCRGDKEKKHQI